MKKNATVFEASGNWSFDKKISISSSWVELITLKSGCIISVHQSEYSGHFKWMYWYKTNSTSILKQIHNQSLYGRLAYWPSDSSWMSNWNLVLIVTWSLTLNSSKYVSFPLKPEVNGHIQYYILQHLVPFTLRLSSSTVLILIGL